MDKEERKKEKREPRMNTDNHGWTRKRERKRRESHG